MKFFPTQTFLSSSLQCFSGSSGDVLGPFWIENLPHTLVWLWWRKEWCLSSFPLIIEWFIQGASPENLFLLLQRGRLEHPTSPLLYIPLISWLSANEGDNATMSLWKSVWPTILDSSSTSCQSCSPVVFLRPCWAWLCCFAACLVWGVRGKRG